MSTERLLGKGCGGEPCKFGCCTAVANRNRKDRKANKRRARRVAKQGR